MALLRRIAIGLAAVILTVVVVVPARGTTVTLKDGTVVIGTMSRVDGGYQITTADGGTRTVSDDDIASISASSAAPSGSQSSISPNASDQFRAAKAKADSTKTAMGGVDAWQRFIDANPDSTDMAAAKDELAHWQSLADSNAEKINGEWIGGDKLREMQTRAEDLMSQARDLWTHDKTLQAIDKLREAVKAYPNSYLANYALGYLSMVNHDYDDAIDYFQRSVRLTPGSPEALNNLAVAHFFRRHFDEGIDGLQKAVEIQDNKQIAQNLVTAMAEAPPGIRSQPKYKSTRETASLLARKYGISGPADWMLIDPPQHKEAADGSLLPPSIVAGGSGFILSNDGLILTNRHVVKAGSIYTVVVGGKKRYSADVVAVDDQYDLALLRIKPADKLPVAQLSPADSPADGADCTVIGFPLMFDMGLNPKITHGIVSSGSSNVQYGADVLIDATVNHGNSGGPIADKFGNVMAIVSMKAYVRADQESYGVGISAGHIREFLDRQHIKLASGTEGDELQTQQVVAHLKPATVCILVSK